MSNDTVDVDTKAFFGLSEVLRIYPKAEIRLTDHSYLPKAMDLRSDWVASVAAPSFLALARVGVTAPNFCAVGTGAGLDGLAAIEILKAQHVCITDVHNDVVERARSNILENVQVKNISVEGYVGDIPSCLENSAPIFDLIYENLPNIPLVNENLYEGQNSSTFIAARKELLPEFVTNSLLALHYIAIQQASSRLRAGGRILSSIGGRVPLSLILRMASGVLAEAFSNVSVEAAGGRALEIERALEPHRISATDTLRAVKDGQQVGHTVAVLDSRKL